MDHCNTEVLRLWGCKPLHLAKEFSSAETASVGLSSIPKVTLTAACRPENGDKEDPKPQETACASAHFPTLQLWGQSSC